MRELTNRTLETLAPNLALPSSNADIAALTSKRSEDPELFRVWGPSNIQIGSSVEDLLDGSADLRMFTDDRFTPEEQGTWFTGSCDYCWLRIRSSRYAVRKPIEFGGWRGQYCSWDCARLDCQEFEAIAKEMTRYYEKQCTDLGIYDHLFTERGVALGARGEPDDDTAPEGRPIVP